MLTTAGGLQNVLPRAAQVTPFRKSEDYRDYIKRIRAAPKLAEDTIARLRPGMASGWMSTKPVLDRIVAAIDAHLVENVEQSALMSPFARMAEGIPEGGACGARGGCAPCHRRRLPAGTAPLQGFHPGRLPPEGAGRRGARLA